jgi:hypothetical protein
MTAYQEMRDNINANMSIEDVRAAALNYLDTIEQVFTIHSDLVASYQAILAKSDEAMT